MTMIRGEGQGIHDLKSGAACSHFDHSHQDMIIRQPRQISPPKPNASRGHKSGHAPPVDEDTIPCDDMAKAFQQGSMMSDGIQTTLTLAELRERRNAILELAARYGAYNVRVFGSVARGDDTPESDVDLLVSYRDGVSLLDVVALWQDLQDLLGRHVDVVDDRAIKPRMRSSIMRDAVPL